MRWELVKRWSREEVQDAWQRLRVVEDSCSGDSMDGKSSRRSDSDGDKSFVCTDAKKCCSSGRDGKQKQWRQDGCEGRALAVTAPEGLVLVRVVLEEDNEKVT